MFGDMGHGSILLTCGLILVLGYDRLKDSAPKLLLQIRYLVLLLGIMSTYCGFIYNEYFALVTSIFPSCYNVKERSTLNPMLSDDLLGENNSQATEATYYYKRRDHSCNYPFG
jgi:vacuolar-type H+-ATPase subunit I/STV1